METIFIVSPNSKPLKKIGVLCTFSSTSRRPSKLGNLRWLRFRRFCGSRVYNFFLKKWRIRAQDLLGFEEFFFFFSNDYIFDREEHGVFRFLINKRKDLTWGSKKEGKSRNLVFKGCMNNK